MISIPFETLAKAHAPMPESLSTAEQQAYQAISLLVYRYKNGLVTVEQAQNEMAQIRQAVLSDFQLKSGWQAIGRYMAGISAACTRYAKEKTPESAEHLYKVVIGLEKETQDEIDRILDNDLTDEYMEGYQKAQKEWRWWSEKSKSKNSRRGRDRSDNDYDDGGDDPERIPGVDGTADSRT